MPHLHHPGTIRRKPGRSVPSTLTQRFLGHLHNTELWANYLPQIPGRLYLLALLGLALAVLSGWVFQSGPAALTGVTAGLALTLPVIGAGFFVHWRWAYRSKVRRQLLDSIAWRGDEMVLDVGCGNGLLLNGAAKRLKNGRAIGIDIWAPHGGGGTLDMLWKNARLEKVADRIEFQEADARQMPFENEIFDVVVSSGAVHHISRTHADFEQALREMIRVLKPGGRIAIWDTAHMVTACAARLKTAGVQCQVTAAGRFLNYDMAIVCGQTDGTLEAAHEAIAARPL